MARMLHVSSLLALAAVVGSFQAHAALRRQEPRPLRWGEGGTLTDEVRGWLGSLMGHRGATARRRQLSPADAERRYREVERRRGPWGNCRSRFEQHLFYKDFPTTEVLEDVLDKYVAMHRRCTDIPDWDAYADLLFQDQEKNLGKQNGCKYVISLDPHHLGIGNRIMNLISSFVFALITDRALLLKHDSPLVEYFCNPFKHSNWTLSETQWKGLIGKTRKGVQKLQNLQLRNIAEGWKDRRMMHVHMSESSEENIGHFFCSEYQMQIFRHLPVISVESDQYFVPGLYFIPEFNQKLNELMPDGRVFMHVGKFLLHPSNKVWLRVTRFYNAYLAHHTRLVGIQVRKFWPRSYNEPVDDRVLECAFNVSHAIPPTSSYEEFLAKQEQAHGFQMPGRTERESVGVFVTSLNRTFADILTDFVNSRVLSDGQLIGVYSLSHEGQEKPDSPQYETALVEMLLLSMCDELLTTDLSTFGYVATGLSGVRPYSMNIVVFFAGDYRKNGRPVCQSISSEPCFHHFPGRNGKLKCGGAEKELTKANLDVGVCDGVGIGLAQKINL